MTVMSERTIPQAHLNETPITAASLEHLAPEWREVTLPNSGRKFHFNIKSRHCQWDAPLFEILDLNAEEADNYSKSEIKAAWYHKKRQVGEEEPLLVRQAYEVLRHTRSRCEYVQKNVASVSPEARRTAANLLSLLLIQ